MGDYSYICELRNGGIAGRGCTNKALFPKGLTKCGLRSDPGAKLVCTGSTTNIDALTFTPDEAAAAGGGGAPVFLQLPSLTPTNGVAGVTTFTGTDGVVSNGTIISRRLLIVDQSQQTSVVAIGNSGMPTFAGTLYYENKAQSPSGAITTVTSGGVAVSAAAAVGPTVQTAAAFVDNGNGTGTFTPATFTGATGQTQNFVDGAGAPIALASGSAPITINFSDYSGRIISLRSLATDGNGGYTRSSTIDITVPASGYSFTNSGLTQADGSSAATVPGLAFLANTPTAPIPNGGSPVIVVKGGKLHMQPGVVEFNSGGVVYPATVDTMMTFVVDSALIAGVATPYIMLGGDNGNFVTIALIGTATGNTTNDQPALTFRLVKDYNSTADFDFRMVLAVGDTLGFKTNGTSITVYRKPVGATAFTQVPSPVGSRGNPINAATEASNYTAGKLGTGIGIGWRSNSYFGYYAEGDFPNFSIVQAVSIPVAVSSISEGFTAKLSNPNRTVRNVTLAVTASPNTALEAAAFDISTGAQLMAYAPLGTTSSAGTLVADTLVPHSSNLNGHKIQYAVRWVADTTKKTSVGAIANAVNSGGVSVSKIGVNDPGVANYGGGAQFLNRMKNAGAWFNNPNPDPNLDANGWPASGTYRFNCVLDSTNPGSVSYDIWYSAGQQVTLSPVGGSITNHTFASGQGHAIYTTITDTTRTASMDCTIGSILNLTSMEIIRSDQIGLRGTVIWNPEYISSTQNFDFIRLMDALATNGSTVVNAADLTKPAAPFWPRIPIAAAAALANERNGAIWVNIPDQATDVCATYIFTSLRDGITAANGVVHYEYSNETWNGAFAQSGRCATKGQALVQANPSLSDVTADYYANLYHGYRTAQVFNIAKTVYGASYAARVIGEVGGWQGAGPAVSANIFRGMNFANVGTIASLAKNYAITTYFGNAMSVVPGNETDRAIVLGWARNGAAGITSAFQQMISGGLLTLSNDGLAQVLLFYRRQAAEAAAVGLRLSAYEGNWHYVYIGATSTDANAYTDLKAFVANIKADARYQPMIQQMFNDAARYGMTGICFFNAYGRDSEFGQWGLKYGPTTPDSPAWSACQAQIASNNA